MKKTTNKKTKLTASIFIVLILMVSVFMAIPSQAQEHGGAPPLPEWDTEPPAGVTPSVTVECTAFMSVSPNPVGKYQSILVNLWEEPPTHVNRYRSGYTVTITKPDGTIVTVGPMNSYQGDTTAWFEYQVDQVGTWRLKFNAAGNYMPAGYYTRDGVMYETEVPGSTFLDSAYYEPSSTAEQELTVEEDMIPSWPPAPLPTDYWTRPISPENREWWSIGGHYPFDSRGGGPNWPTDTNTYASNYKFTPYVQAPNTAHIVWRRQYDLGGLVGGQFGYWSYYIGGPFGSNTNIPRIIFMGRAYQTYSKPGAGKTAQTYWQCYDIRTGEIYWERPLEPGESAPTNILYSPGIQEVPGAESTWREGYSLVSIGSRLTQYNPFTGALILNVTGMSGTLYNNPYVLSVQNLGGGNYRLINWTTENVAGQWIRGAPPDNFTDRIMNNITWPFRRLGTCDYESMVSVTTESMISPGMGTSHGTRVIGVSLVDGTVLWNTTTDDITFSGSTYFH